MLYEFLEANREALIARCRAKVANRPAPRPSDGELQYGIPLFLDQLIKALRLQETAGTAAAQQVSFTLSALHPGRQASTPSSTAAKHGNELLRKGFTVDQVVHDYGDLCQAVTEMAVEQRTSVTPDEFRTLNRCLDDAIADAVSEFGRQRDQLVADASTYAMNEHLGFLAHELRTLIGTAIFAVAAIKRGDVGIAGATGAVLDRSLIALRDLVDRTLVEVRLSVGIPERREHINVAEFIAHVQVAATMEAATRDLEVAIAPIEEGLAVDADRQTLTSAAANLLENAVKFTRPHGRISLRAYGAADRILIEVEDECGGLPPGQEEAIFRPFAQSAPDRTGLGLGLPISRRGVEANGGKLYVRNLPDTGCIFTIDLPRPAADPS